MVPAVAEAKAGSSSGKSSAPVSPAGFPRLHRLVKPAEFTRVFRRNRRSADKLFTVLASPNDVGHPRLGLAIAKKSIALAVQRNRVKRLTRERFRLNRASLPAVDLVVMARPGIARFSNEKLDASLARHFAEIKRRCEH